MKLILFLLFTSYILNTTAQTSFFVTPYSTNSNYDVNQDSIAVSFDISTQNGKLVFL
jgi:hypothetical protein